MKGKKTGGRQPGSVNKTTSEQKTLISTMLSEYQTSGLMTEDFKQLEPKDRLAIAERLMQYVMPKMQATTLEATESTKITIEDKLLSLS